MLQPAASSPALTLPLMPTGGHSAYGQSASLQKSMDEQRQENVVIQKNILLLLLCQALIKAMNIIKCLAFGHRSEHIAMHFC